jgi:hypothetical protein
MCTYVQAGGLSLLPLTDACVDISILTNAETQRSVSRDKNKVWYTYRRLVRLGKSAHFPFFRGASRVATFSSCRARFPAPTLRILEVAAFF